MSFGFLYCIAVIQYPPVTNSYETSQGEICKQIVEKYDNCYFNQNVYKLLLICIRRVTTFVRLCPSGVDCPFDTFNEDYKQIKNIHMILSFEFLILATSFGNKINAIHFS